MSFKLDTSKFKKIRADKHSTTMRHEDGHELTIAHKALSPKMRSQLASLPAAEPQKMAEGGQVIQGPLSPEEREIIKGNREWEAEHKAPADSEETIVQRSRHFKQGQAEDAAKKYAAGGGVDSPEKIAADAAALAAPAPQEQAPAPQAPVVVNVQAPAAAPAPRAAPADESVMHKVGGAMGWALNHTPIAMGLHAAQSAAPVIKEGLTDAIAGAQGIPSEQLKAQMAQAEASSPAPAAAPQMTPAAPTGAPAAPSDPYGTNKAFDVYQEGIKKGKEGIADAAAAAQSLSKDQVAAAEAQAKQQATLQSEWQTNSRRILDDTKNALTALNEGHINPNHYMENLSAGKKVMTAIGLILGGIGGGASGKNAALDFLNSQIDRDIQAQKAELGKKETVFSGFLKQYGNEKDAADMARIFQNQAYSLQLQKAAAANGGPAAQAAAKQALSALDMNTAQLQGQLAMRKTLLSGVNQGRVPPEMLLRAGVVDAKDHAQFTKELTEAQELAKARDMTLAALQEVAKLNTLGNRISSPLQTPSRIAALKQPVVAALSKATAGRFTEQDAHMLDTLFSGMTDNAETNALKLKQADKLISEKAVFPTLKAYNVDVSKFGRYGAPTGGAPQKRIQLGPPVR